MKLFYKVDPTRYAELMERTRSEFAMHKEVDEEDTILRMQDQSSIEIVVGSFDPSSDDTAMVRVVLNDKRLRARFDSIFGVPFMVK
jgi:hypothetical protein